MITNKITQWSPLREFEAIQNRFENLLRNPSRHWWQAGDGLPAIDEWSPLVDIAEGEKSYVIKVELPEVKKEDIKVSVGDGVLSISGERKFEKEKTNTKYHRVERSYGSFSRTFSLPNAVESDHVEAGFKDGVLTVQVPKIERSQPQQTEVKIS